MARRRHGLAHDDPVRPQRRSSRRPALRAAEFPELAGRLNGIGDVRHNAYMLRFATDGYEFTVFPDGRAIIKGTNDVTKARTLVRSICGELEREHDLPRQRRHQLPQARVGLPGPRPVRPHQPGESRAGQGTGWPSPPNGRSTRRAMRSISSFTAPPPSAGSSRSIAPTR